MTQDSQKQTTNSNEGNVTDDFSLEIEVPDIEIEYQDTDESDCEGCKI